MILDSNALNIFTDGSCYLLQKRKGGFGFLFVFPEFLNLENIEFCPYGYKNTTNNQMELKACSEALKQSLKFKKEWSRIVIYTDSSYVCDNYKRAVYEWMPSGGNNRYGRPIDNYSLWKDLIRSIKDTKCSVDIKHVKGHDKSEENKKADNLAKRSSDNPVNSPIDIVIVRRRKFSKKQNNNKVEISGQKIKIRVVTSKYLKQKIYKIKYEVVAKSNKFYGCIDSIYSNYCLRPGHVYLVRFNSDNNFSQIERIIKEFK